jgi:hypothetical protein
MRTAIRGLSEERCRLVASRRFPAKVSVSECQIAESLIEVLTVLGVSPAIRKVSSDDYVLAGSRGRIAGPPIQPANSACSEVCDLARYACRDAGSAIHLKCDRFTGRPGGYSNSVSSG